MKDTLEGVIIFNKASLVLCFVSVCERQLLGNGEALAFPSHLMEHRKGPPVENRNESSLFTLDEFNTEGVNSMRRREKMRKRCTLSEHQRESETRIETESHIDRQKRTQR